MSNPESKPQTKTTNSSQQPTDPRQAVSISHKLEQLDRSVEWFHSDEFNLDEAIAHYRAATQLAQEIEQDLNELKNQVEVIADLTKTA